MTGYSSVRCEEAGYSLSVSLRSINHRFLDLQLRLPANLEPLDPPLRRLIKERVSRGHLEVTVSLERAGTAQIQLNRKLLDAYVTACDELRKEFGCTSEPDWVALLRVPGMVTAGDGEIPAEELGRIQPMLERVAAEGLERLNAMRAEEGAVLERDVRSRMERLETLCTGIQQFADRVPQLYQRRLEARVRELLREMPGGELDHGRLAQEVAFLASRADVSEELTRFRSHLDQIKHLLHDGSEAGKKLDFLLQEMNREANTLLSKTTDVPEVGPEIARQAIEMKTEIEKLREQAQNIE